MIDLSPKLAVASLPANLQGFLQALQALPLPSLSLTPASNSPSYLALPSHPLLLPGLCRFFVPAAPQFPTVAETACSPRYEKGQISLPHRAVAHSPHAPEVSNVTLFYTSIFPFH